ncbi:glycosyltransferase [Photobacterium carnosum]|uniref:glycosyltransferase n=1 Tax=Photobacterium carnosum TaxID=2023717 RepID=UPI00242A786E|nr:glycosyltransferase [Photobacterium carnosum]
MEDFNPLVTIVIVCFNNSSFIKDSLDSVMMQDYHNLEVLIYDNGSSDSSVEIIKKHALYHKSKAFFNEQNLGLIPVLNDSLKKANGKYITFLAGDDRILFDKISYQVKFLEENDKYYACAGSQIKIDKNGMNLSKREQKNIIDKFLVVDKKMLFNKTNIIYSPTAIYNKEILKKLGGYDENILIEDLYIYYKAAFNNYELALIPKVFTEYRIHNNNSHTKYDWMVDNKIKILELYNYKIGYEDLKRLIYLESFYILAKSNKKRALTMLSDVFLCVINKPFDYKNLYFLSGIFSLLFRW